MQKPQPPQERHYMPFWAHRNSDRGQEEIKVMVSGEGNPIDENELDPEDPESEQKFRQSPRGRLLAAILGDELNEFVQSALDGEDDMDWSYGGWVTVAHMQLFSEIYDVPFDTVEVHLTDRPGEGLFLHGTRLHTEDEIAEARRPYEEALAQYERDLAEWERLQEQQAQEAKMTRGEKYSMKSPQA